MQENTVIKQRVPNAERRKSSIKSVLDSALSLFVTQGYDATSMDDIASRAGLTKGAVYFYFKDKLSLLHALLERTEAELFDPIFAETKRLLLYFKALKHFTYSFGAPYIIFYHLSLLQRI